MGIGEIGLVVGRKWENFMALSLYEPEVAPCLFTFVSCPLRVCLTHLSFTLFYFFKMAALPATTVLNNINSEILISMNFMTNMLITILEHLC